MCDYSFAVWLTTSGPPVRPSGLPLGWAFALALLPLFNNSLRLTADTRDNHNSNKQFELRGSFALEKVDNATCYMIGVRTSLQAYSIVNNHTVTRQHLDGL